MNRRNRVIVVLALAVLGGSPAALGAVGRHRSAGHHRGRAHQALPRPTIMVLSNRADLVSGGEALATTNPSGVRCTLADYMINVFGRRPRAVWTADERKLLGGDTIDLQPTAARTPATEPALSNDYRSGAVNETNNLADVAIIDLRGPDPVAPSTMRTGRGRSERGSKRRSGISQRTTSSGSGRRR